MKIKKLKKKLDFLYINKFLNNKNLFIFDFINKSKNYKYLNKNLVRSLIYLNSFLYKYPLYIEINQKNDILENFVLIKVKNFFFQSHKLCEQCLKNIFIKFQKFCFYYLRFIFVVLKRKNC